MYFKPRIFISSTFAENKDLRQRIDDYYKSIGADPLLYERELTPSVLPNTYRYDVLDADFMILIIKENYGTKTDTGMSGIHEEYLIAQNHHIPLHVYIKKQEDSVYNPLLSEIKSNGISYYYFEDDNELLHRLQETTFTIAKEIMLSKVSVNSFPQEMIAKLSGQSDYDRGMEVVSVIDAALEQTNMLEMDLVYSNVLVELTDRFNCEFGIKTHKFINWKLDDIMKELLELANEFSKHSADDFMRSGTYRTVHLPIIGEVDFYNLTAVRNGTWGLDNYKKLLFNLQTKYNTFKKTLQDIHMEVSKLG